MQLMSCLSAQASVCPWGSIEIRWAIQCPLNLALHRPLDGSLFLLRH
jgi:hypothetical protein